MSPDTAQRQKRRFERIPARNLVSFVHQTPEAEGEPTDGLARTLDVSAGGARVETDRQLKIGDRLHLEIALGSMIVNAEAIVVHVAPGRDSMIEAGVSFDRIPPSDRETLIALGY